MNVPIIVAILAALCSVLSTACALYVAARSGKWRDTDDAKALVARIERAEKWGETDAARQLVLTVQQHANRLAAGEERFTNLATKADVARLESDFQGLQRVVSAEVRAVHDKIDDMRGDVSEIRRWLIQENKA